MRLTIAILAVAFLGLGRGLGSAQFALDQGLRFQTQQIDGWTAWVNATTSDADPYTRAHFGRNGELPPPPLESLAFSTNADASGDAIRGGCTYRIEGQFPASRFWTLIAYREDGTLVENPSKRYGFSSRQILRRDDGSGVIKLSARPMPGNWVPLDPDASHQVRLTLYDSPLAAQAFLLEPVMPRVVGEPC
ncbi:MAG: DUF1214 domain-containing protein [Pseudomonadota bacterium]